MLTGIGDSEVRSLLSGASRDVLDDHLMVDTDVLHDHFRTAVRTAKPTDNGSSQPTQPTSCTLRTAYLSVAAVVF